MPEIGFNVGAPVFCTFKRNERQICRVICVIWQYKSSYKWVMHWPRASSIGHHFTKFISAFKSVAALWYSTRGMAMQSTRIGARGGEKMSPAEILSRFDGKLREAVEARCLWAAV